MADVATVRFHFTIEDLSRVRVAAADPVAETLFSFRFLRQRGERGKLQQWHADVRSRLSGGSNLSMLAPLLPPHALSFDLFTLCGLTGSVEGAVENLRTRTAVRLSAEVAYADALAPLPRWIRHIAEADREYIDLLGVAVSRAHRAIVAPYWPQIQARLNAERAGHGRALLNFGVEHMLANLHPAVRWRPPVLEVPSPCEADRHLGGRGIVVIPSVFCRPLPIPVLDYSAGEDEPPEAWLFVPAAGVPDASPSPLTDPVADGRALATLLGRTRAAVLRAVAAGPVTTSGLARRVGVSISAASQHAGVLREAGLIATQRVGKAVLHTTTTTGETLLAGGAFDGTTGSPGDPPTPI
ncbi:ArsR family transcriptional regulator [Actinomadura sp. KC06]|uniref:ArsR/SmtB family transcription factor n=1 Tax=Actinomadura sp. KC06 TaxID=2530369 RepID=UPI00104344B4|nr:winged helix-turn-helix domain-containing protein [Actinomadura sp. KC06]TDD34943.1 ArsR family transcriptional regulator [Actinomadura sp. KC06]